MITIKSRREFQKMAKAGAVVAVALEALRDAVRPGIPLKKLDSLAEDVIRKQGCTPSFLHYQGTYPASICASPNDVIVHGIPTDYRLGEGDLLSLDVGAIYEGFHGDAAITVAVGAVPAAVTNLIRVTEEALWAGIWTVREGARLGDVGAAVHAVGDRHGYGVVRDYVGHGIGRQMHEEPQVPNYGVPGKGVRLRTGMAICLEPMFNMGTHEARVDPDGWTVRTADGSLSAHFEHTVAITPEGVRVFTLTAEERARADLVSVATNG
ncbi:MAG TPA: type I methionyl aminopeptidase [Acidimicrobiia bacterium]|nr:type I methionyl aminopeptidase [Acidimicrobiia bacterium]